MIYAVDVSVHPAAAPARDDDDDDFVTAAHNIIKHPRGWESLGYTFVLRGSSPPPRRRQTRSPAVDSRSFL